MQGPLLLPARVLLIISGVLAIALGAFNLAHERHIGNVDVNYMIGAGILGVIWLVSLALAWRGNRLGVILTGLIAFAEFGVIAQTHFTSGSWSIDTYAKKEGLEMATVALALLPLCALTAMAAVVTWDHATGQIRRLQTLPLLVVSLIGAALTLLYLTDAVHRSDFGKSTAEDASFMADIAVTLWIFGALWIARARRTGALLIVVGTGVLSYAFIAQHLLSGGTPISTIGAQSGTRWEGIALAAVTLASASFITAVALVSEEMMRGRRTQRKAAA